MPTNAPTIPPCLSFIVYTSPPPPGLGEDQHEDEQNLPEDLQSSHVDLVRIAAAFAAPERFDAGFAATAPAVNDGGTLPFYAEHEAQ